MAFDPDAYLGKKSGGKAAAFDPDVYLGRSAASESDYTELPPDAGPVKLDLKGKTGVVPEKRTRAVFSDITPSGEPGYTAEELRDAKPDTKAKAKTAFVGGALQGATMGFGDEAAALFDDKPYAEARDENRRAFRDAEAMSPKDYAMGHLAGAAAMIPATPSLAPVAGKSLLSAGNMARAATAGGIQGLGESEADLTKGDLYGAAKDTAKGAAVAAGVNTGLGTLGKGYKAGARYLAGSPERVTAKADDALIDAATLGAPASQRDALMGELGSERPGVLDLIKSSPELRKAIEERRHGDAANIIRTMQAEHAGVDSRTMAELDSGARTIAPQSAAERVPGHRDPALATTQELPALSMEDVIAGREASASVTAPKRPGSLAIDARPLVAKLEARHKALAANPAVESQAEAAATQKRINYLKDNWIPEPPPKKLEGNELLGKLMEGGDAGDKQRAGSKAGEFLRVAEEHKLGDVAHDPHKTLEAAENALKGMGKEREKLYGQLGEAAEVPIGNVTAKLSAWRDELSKSGADLDDVPKVDALIANIWQAAKNRGGKASMTAEDLREQISKIQKKAFSGSYMDPTKSAEMGREAAGRMREAFDEHVAKIDASMPPDSEVGRKIADLNRRYSPMIAFRDAAEKRAAAANLQPPLPPETRTGLAKPSEVRSMINATKDEDVKRELTGELYSQLGTENAHKLAALDDKANLMSRLEAPLTHLAERGATPPTTLRHHAGSLMGYLEHGGIGGGVALASIGHVKEGVAVIGATLASKYGPETFRAAERGIASMVTASRQGATAANLRTLAKIAKVPKEMAEDAIVMLAPRESATGKTKESKR